jgi:hypothetical protein
MTTGYVPQYLAIFTDGDAQYAVIFDSKEAAAAYAAAPDHGLTFLGIARRVGLSQLARIAARQDLAATGGSPHRTGRITRWIPDATNGFATDTEGRSWFVSREDLPGGKLYLPLGTEITFSGLPNPRPGKKYPQAYSVQIVRWGIE